MFEKSFVKSDSSLSPEDNVNEIEHAREKRGRVEQTNPVAAKKVFESTVNPLKKLITVDTRIDSSLSTSNVLIIITKLIILVKIHQIFQPVNIHLGEEFVVKRIITLLIGDINLKVKRDSGLGMTKKLFPKSRE